MRRAVILTTLTLLLLAIMGISLAGESTIGPESGFQTESTIQDATTTTMGPTDTTVWETTNTTDEGHSQRSGPAAGTVTEDPTDPEAVELEGTGEEATEAEGKKGGKPEGVGKPKGVGGEPVGNGKAKDDEGEARGGGNQDKVTFCHKGKHTIAVGASAQAAHVRHGDTVGSCESAGAAPEPAQNAPGAGVAQNGDSGGGNGQQTVALCHKGKTLTVGEPAKEAHLRHGDTEGPCAGQ